MHWMALTVWLKMMLACYKIKNMNLGWPPKVRYWYWILWKCYNYPYSEVINDKLKMWCYKLHRLQTQNYCTGIYHYKVGVADTLQNVKEVLHLIQICHLVPWREGMIDGHSVAPMESYVRLYTMHWSFIGGSQHPTWSKNLQNVWI